MCCQLLDQGAAAVQPKEKFERDLGEGRKLKVDPSTMQNNSSRVTAVSAV